MCSFPLIRIFAGRCKKLNHESHIVYLPLGDSVCVCVYPAKCWLKIKGSFPRVFIESVWYRISSVSPQLHLLFLSPLRLINFQFPHLQSIPFPLTGISIHLSSVLQNSSPLPSALDQIGLIWVSPTRAPTPHKSGQAYSDERVQSGRNKNG